MFLMRFSLLYLQQTLACDKVIQIFCSCLTKDCFSFLLLFSDNFCDMCIFFIYVFSNVLNSLLLPLYWHLFIFTIRRNSGLHGREQVAIVTRSRVLISDQIVNFLIKSQSKQTTGLNIERTYLYIHKKID